MAAWFRTALGEPTRAQQLGWPPIARGESALLLAPTGSGKTLAAFLVAIDGLMRRPPVKGAARGPRVLYVSPHKALAVDIERNLARPLAGIADGRTSRQNGRSAKRPRDRHRAVCRRNRRLVGGRHVALGTRVIAPWAIAVAARLRETYVDVDVHYTDDGMAFRIPACEKPPPPEAFLPSPDAIEELVTQALRDTPLFAARFRECAARALLLPQRDPRRRTPLWAQRKRAADLLAVASRHPTFPIVLETYRECLRDAFDVPGLTTLLRDVAERRVRVTVVDTHAPSPFAASVLFAFVANFIYEGDAPPAERRAQALTIDFDRLRELLGDTELRQLLDAEAIEQHERWLQRLSRPATHADAVHDLLRAVGDLSLAELAERVSPPDAATVWLEELERARRVLRVRIAGEDDSRRQKTPRSCGTAPDARLHREAALPAAKDDGRSGPRADLRRSAIRTGARRSRALYSIDTAS